MSTRTMSVLSTAQAPERMVENWWYVRDPTKGTIAGPVWFSMGQMRFVAFSSADFSIPRVVRTSGVMFSVGGREIEYRRSVMVLKGMEGKWLDTESVLSSFGSGCILTMDSRLAYILPLHGL
jgi:hypothetical protein